MFHPGNGGSCAGARYWCVVARKLFVCSRAAVWILILNSIVMPTERESLISMSQVAQCSPHIS